MERLIKFFLVVVLGVALGYAWATYHAYVRYVNYEKVIAMDTRIIADYEYRLKHCKTKYIWARGRTTFEAKKP